jgi:3'-phosphoadenosine 5'-phosphosulfate sulfotransferase (PAPS reductase)/FAD synthetase
MLKKTIEANDGLPPEAIVCFANTGKETEETLEFVRDCERNWNVPIRWLEFRDDERKFASVTFETASRNGEPFDALIMKRGMLPNPVSRFCTVELKVRTIHRYLKSIGWSEWNSFLGIRADEPYRVAKIKNNDYGKHEEKSAPLAEAGVTAADVGDFWKAQLFDLNHPNINGVTMEGNCDLCFLKGGNQVFSLIQQKPERAIWWSQAESMIQTTKLSGRRFRIDRPSYQEMLDFASAQKDWIDDATGKIPCYCGD